MEYTLHLADDVLILGHRNSEWTGHGPILEQDIALSNIALDLIGQARNFYQYAAGLAGNDSGESIYPAGGGGVVTEDTLAFLRDGWDFRNSLLTEQTNGDWAKTILRQFFFSAFQVDLYEQLAVGRDTTLAAIGAKAYKEALYHLRWSSEWVIRLGDGTDESHQRMKKALEELWKFTGELYIPAPYERWAAEAEIGPDLSQLRVRWKERVKEVFDEAGLTYPVTEWMQTGGKEGRHTEQLGYVLAEMQFLQRAYPGCEW
ncbi:MAG: phenylacetate-CoA oxygenase subunit PaaC [Chitinophagaceae bacterium]|nr:phenylacetate-CoA oxygenase subunit PaaC [Chitinophagaceae bacterium]